MQLVITGLLVGITVLLWEIWSKLCDIDRNTKNRR